MAVGTGFGLDLSQLDAAIKNADEALKSLAKTGERTSKQINEAFSLAKNGNIQDFISVIERLSNTLGKKGYNQAAQMVREIATETTSAIDRVNRFATLMQTISDGGRSNVKNGAIESLKYQLDEALSRLGVLNERLQFYTKGEGAKAVNTNVVDTSALQDEANKLRVVVELLQRRLEHEQALAALKQRSGAIENQQALNTSWQKMEEERTKQLQQQSINAKEANKAYEQAYNDRYQMYAVMYDKMWQEDLKHFERQNANAKSGGQQYAKEYEERTRFYEKWINESYALEEEKAARAKKLEEERVALELDKKRKLSEMAQAEENARYNKWLENNDKEYAQKEAKERELFNKTIERIGKQSAEFQKAEDARYQRWLELKDKEKQREQADESAKFQRQKNTIYQQNARFAAEELRIRRQLSEETIDAVVSEARKRIEVERLVRAEQKKAHDQRQRELEELFREQERQAKAQAQYDSKARKEKYKSYTTSYEGAIRTSNKANTLAKEIQAVKNLEAAREKLKKTDADYHRKLGELNTRIKQHNQNIERATAGTKKLNGALAAVGRGIASAFSVQALRGYVNQMIKVRGEMELQQRSLQAILQNKDAANEIWQKTIDLAVRSPFRIKDLVTYTKQLAAYRVEADKLYDTNKMLADVSAGLGVDMNRLILAFGQVKAANFLRGTELRQFTEAGIPMLDELAKHFNDMNNTALTSADVFEMISKRMVLFEDVEAVFERLTKAGGTFYRMQEIQAETLRGQISNLKDSIDIMLNDMGKANDGTMKFAVKSVKSLVDNYERLVPILKAVATALLLYKLNAFLAARQTGILSSMLLNAGVAMEKFILTMAKNPWTLIITAIIAAGAAMYRFHKQLKEVDKTYRDMLNQQSEITAKFFKAEDIDERKRALKDLIEYAGKEYSIKVSLDLKDMSDSDVTNAMNRLRQQMIEANAFGATFQKELLWANSETFWEDFGTRGVFEQGLNRDIDQIGDSYDNLNRILVNNLSPTIDYLSTKLENLNEDQRDALKSLKAGIGEWSNNDEDMVDYFDRIRGNYETLIGLLSKSDNIADKKIARQLKKYQTRYNEAEKEFQTFVNRIDDDIANLNAEDKAIFLSAAIDDAKSEKNWSEFEETQIRKWLEKKYEIELTPKIVKEDKELKAWQDSYNDLFEGKTGWKKIRTKGTSQTQVIEQLNAQYKATEELVKRIQNAGEDSILEGGAYEGENLEKLKKDLKDIKAQLDWFGVEDNKGGGSGKDEVLERLKNRINLIKEMNKEYEKLNKTFLKTESLEKVQKAYASTAKELGLDTSTMDFTDEGTIKSLEALLGKPEYAANEYVIELQKALDNFKVQLGVEVKQDADKELNDEIQALFDRYELTLDIKKLGMPKGLAEDLFNTEFLDLKGLREAVKEREAEFIGTDQEKQYKEFLEKIDEMERKSIVERTKTYAEYLMRGMTERTKLKVEELRKLKELEDSKEFTTDQKKQIREQIQVDSQKKLDKAKWEEFTGMDSYIMMFEDLETLGTQSIKNLYENLDKLRLNLSHLDPSEVKEIVNQMEKLQEEMIKRNPFKAFRDARKDIKAVGVDEETLINRLFSKEKIEAEARQMIDSIATIENAFAEGTFDKLRDEEKNLFESFMPQFAEGKDLAKIKEEYQDILDAAREGKTITADQLKNFADYRKALQGVSEYWGAINDQIQNIVGSSINIMEVYGVDESTKAIAEGVGNMSTLITQAVQFGVQMKAVGYASNMALGVIGWIAMGIQAISTIITSIANYKNAQIDEQLESQAKKIERQRDLYEQIEKKVESAYNVDQLRRYNNEMERSVELEIQALEASIALERSRKKADEDQIADWQKEITEARERLAESKQEMMEELGGMFDINDFTSGFVDAWWDAMDEGMSGLDALSDHFEDTMKDMVKKQALYRGAQEIMSQVQDAINKSLEGDFTIDDGEWQAIMDAAKKANINLDAFLQGWYDMFGAMSDGASGSLSALQKGIQGLSEETGQIIEAYLNSIRGYVSEQVTHTKNIYNILYDATRSESRALWVRLAKQ